MAAKRRLNDAGYRSRKRVKDDKVGSSVLDSITINPMLVGSPTKKPIKNPIKQSNWKLRRDLSLNPYINQEDVSLEQERKPKLGGFSERGRYIKQANELRNDVKKMEDEAKKQQQLKKLNLLPNKALGEDKYEPRMPPSVDWWDSILINGHSYESIDSTDGLTYKDLMSEDNPITIYIQHPVPILASSEAKPQEESIFLTKKEKKRLRRHERMTKLKEKQDKIKLGLEPVPPPKVKLKNLMNVLTNETIKNPTEVEMRVKREVAERKAKHDLMNEERKLTREEKHEKFESRLEDDRNNGCFSCVFKIGRLVSPKNLYKVDVNAKEYQLTGVCVRLKGGISMVIVEGGSKALKKYKKLMLRRIRWTDNERKKGDDDSMQSEIEDLTDNYCCLVWEGELPSPHFKRWTLEDYESEEELIHQLDRYHVTNYWTQAITLS